jgi:hypothetical protein
MFHGHLLSATRFKSAFHLIALWFRVTLWFSVTLSLAYPLLHKLILAHGGINERGHEADGVSPTTRFTQPATCAALMLDAHPHTAIGQPFHLQPSGGADPDALAAADACVDIDDDSPLIRLL